MLDTIQALLDAFPEGVIQAQDGLVTGANPLAVQYLPQLAVGEPLPDCILTPRSAPTGAGGFALGGTSFSFSCTDIRGEQLILFRPAPQSALTDPQLAGALRQLRELLGDILAQVGPGPDPTQASLPAGGFSRSFLRLFRLVGDLEYMQEAADSEGAAFRPANLDLDQLCRQTVSDAYDLLLQSGRKLEYESVCSGLLIPGDRVLLRRALLALISNSAKSVGEGSIQLSLRTLRSRALICLSDSGPLPSPQQLAALFQQGAAPELPLPGQGAGLGLTIARHIVDLHRGTLLVEWGHASPGILISLPTGPLKGKTDVRSPLPPQRDGGLDPVLVALSDVLPAQLFSLDDLE